MRYKATDYDFEQFLQRLNATLSAEFMPVTPIMNPQFLTAQILGLPRSGTTILYQLLARSRAVGYPSNVFAFFWQAPVIGAQLQKQLAATHPTVSLESLAGRTTEPLDPHEFGYFWRAVLGHSGNSLTRDQRPWPWDSIQSTLDTTAEVFQSPVVYKNFLALSHMSEMRANLSRQRYLVLERPLVDIAASLLNVRRRIGIGDDSDFGLTAGRSGPDNEKSVMERVVEQVLDLDRLMNLSAFADDPNAYVIPYADLCAQPRYIVDKALRFIGAEVENLEESIPEVLHAGGGAANLPARDRRLLTERLEKDSS